MTCQTALGLKFVFLLMRKLFLTISSCVRVCRAVEHLGSLESMHEGGVIVAWGAAESNSSLLGALQTSQVRSPRFSRLRRSTRARACTPLTKSEEEERLLAVQLFWLAFHPTQTQPLLYSKRRIQKNSPLTFWQLERFTVHLTLIMRKCLHEHWSWSTFAYELYTATRTY